MLAVSSRSFRPAMRPARALRHHAAIALVVLLGSSSSAFGQSDAAIAEGLFQDGRKLMSSGDTAAACAKFAESQRLAPKLGTLLNLATCHEKEGKTASAWSEFTDAAAQANRTGDSRASFAQQHAQSLEGQLSRLVIEIKTPTDGLVINLDGRAVGNAAWGTPIPVDPGDHKIEASAPGYRPWSGTAAVAKGANPQNIEVPALELAPAEKSKGATDQVAPAPLPPPDAGDEKSGATQRAVGGTLIGVGVAGVIVGAIFGVRTFSLKNASDANCGANYGPANGDPNKCSPEGKDQRDSAKTSGIVSTIAFGAGAAFAAVGVAVVLTAPSNKHRAPSSGRSTWVSPTAGPSGAGVRLGTTWY